VRGFDLRSRTASCLYCTAAARWAAWRPISCPRSPREGGVARCFDLRPRTSLRLLLLRRGWVAWRPDSCPRSAGVGERRTAPTYALAQRRGSHGYGASAAGRHSARLLPSLCTRGGRRAAPTCAGWRARLRLALLYSIAARAAARLRLGGVAPDSCPRSAREGGGARLRLTLSRRVAARVLLRRVCGWATWRPDSCPRSTRGRHAAHLHSRTSSRLVRVLLRHVCGLAAWRPTLARAAAAGAARGSDLLRSRVESQLILLRRVYGWRLGKVASRLALALHARVGGARLRINSRTSSRLVLLRRVCGLAARRPTLALALYARVGGARFNPFVPSLVLLLQPSATGPPHVGPHESAEYNTQILNIKPISGQVTVPRSINDRGGTAVNSQLTAS